MLCDPKTKYILTGNKKFVDNEMYKSFYGLAEKSIYFGDPIPFGDWYKSS